MKSFQFDTKKIVRDTKIPTEKIPQIIIHWYSVHYYGGTMTILDLRKFLESRLRNSFHSKEAVTAWIKNAEGFEVLHPQLVSNLTNEYFQIRLMA